MITISIGISSIYLNIPENSLENFYRDVQGENMNLKIYIEPRIFTINFQHKTQIETFLNFISVFSKKNSFFMKLTGPGIQLYSEIKHKMNSILDSSHEFIPYIEYSLSHIDNCIKYQKGLHMIHGSNFFSCSPETPIRTASILENYPYLLIDTRTSTKFIKVS